MRTPKFFLGIFALALILPLMLLACGGSWAGLKDGGEVGGSDEPTDGPASERSTAEPTDLPDSERPTDEPETPASPARTPSTPESGDTPTATDAPVPATAPPAATGSVETDREALVILYNATDGENWDNSENWLSDAPLGEWLDVTTDDDGRVTELRLNNNELSGEIPPELGSLSLQILSLRANGLVGEIPPELGSLSNLELLALSDNELSWEIPPELGNLSNLDKLFLDNSDLSGCVPSSLEDQLTSSDLGGLPYC